MKVYELMSALEKYEAGANVRCFCNGLEISDRDINFVVKSDDIVEIHFDD